MTEERKQELKQLLNEAMMSLQIRRTGTDPALLSVDVYRKHLQRRWTFYSKDSASVLAFNPYITNEVTKSKLLDFIRAEFASFIHEDKIQSASFFLLGGVNGGFPLENLLAQLLNIAIVRGIEGAVSAFDRCTEDMPGSYQYTALLEGIKLKTEIQVFEGIRLMPLPSSTSEIRGYLPNLYTFNRSELSVLGKTLLIIDFLVSPVFHKPPTTDQEYSEQQEHKRLKVSGGEFPNFNTSDFYEKFCQALSLACNSPVQISLEWGFLAEDQLFNLSFGISNGGCTWHLGPFGDSTEVGEIQIDEAKRLYDILVNLDSNIRERLRIPIGRWIKSKTSANFVDKMIDLGIAFEALYVPDSGRGEIRFKLAVRAAWHLGKNKDDRNKLLTKFKQIYDHRSNAVHSGQLDEKVKFGGGRIPISEFIEKAQDLCQKSIMRVLEDGQFPDWNDLILGGEVESDLI